MLRPLGHRVIVKPTEPPTTTDSGLVLLQDTSQPEMSGEVIAVGNGRAAAHRIRTATVRRCIEILSEVADRVPASALRAEAEDALMAYLMEPAPMSDVAPGDYVCFSYTAGSVLTIDGQKLLLLNEDDLAAVWQPEAAEVA